MTQTQGCCVSRLLVSVSSLCFSFLTSGITFAVISLSLTLKWFVIYENTADTTCDWKCSIEIMLVVVEQKCTPQGLKS